jgi:hypothetical protein
MNEQPIDTIVIPHFVGAAPGSTNIRNTLTRFCNEICMFIGIVEEIPEDYRYLISLNFHFKILIGNSKTLSFNF